MCEKKSIYVNEYQLFWDTLKKGESLVDEYQYVGKNGIKIYLAASYNPIFDDTGKIIKFIAYGMDVSRQKIKDQELSAISRIQAVIYFKLDGTVLDANEIFLSLMEYTIDEVRGVHHSTL